MKSKLIKVSTFLCTLALALTPFYHFKGCSIVFFGEPEYPKKK